jgi:U1 small nuclear ribonucleoprotein
VCGPQAFDLTETDLKSEFEYYGPITKVRVVKDKKGKSRGYAFVEFESSKDLKGEPSLSAVAGATGSRCSRTLRDSPRRSFFRAEAYRDADGRKINGRRIVVDVERGRTVKNWKPRHLGA